LCRVPGTGVLCSENIDPSKIRKGIFCLGGIIEFMKDFLFDHVSLPLNNRDKELFSLFEDLCGALATAILQVVAQVCLRPYRFHNY
jgi:hypothetical protein